jgi:hypothetical protein
MTEVDEEVHGRVECDERVREPLEDDDPLRPDRVVKALVLARDHLGRNSPIFLQYFYLFSIFFLNRF